jgi:C1A family cysteine protease
MCSINQVSPNLDEHPKAVSSHGRKYGWKKDQVTLEHVNKAHRYTYKVVQHPTYLSQVTTVDLRGKCPPVLDQGQLGACTAFGNLGCFQTVMMKQGLQNEDMSPLWLYHQERVKEGTVDEDSGAQVHTGIDVLTELGVPTESLWPYVIERYAEDPSMEANDNAELHKLLEVCRVQQQLDDVKTYVLTGLPVVFGCIVFQSFESPEVAQTGMVPVPKFREPALGGHCMAIVGFDDTVKGGSFIVRNSWGTSWGLAGYCYIPYAYLMNKKYASDFWAYSKVQITEDPTPTPIPEPAPSPCVCICTCPCHRSAKNSQK